MHLPCAVTLDPMTPSVHLAWLALSWLLYGLIHSGLAMPGAKSWFRKHSPRHCSAYRLIYNAIAAALLIPPLWLMFSYSGAALWQLPQSVRLLADAAALTAVAGVLWTARSYDTGEFLGVSQLRAGVPGVEDQSPLRLSWMHRFVRHPWYFFGLVVLWTREMNAAWLVSAVIITLYLILGSRREEQDLVARFGDRYRFYRKHVPPLIPLPWRYLTAAQLDALKRIPENDASPPASR